MNQTLYMIVQMNQGMVLKIILCAYAQYFQIDWYIKAHCSSVAINRYLTFEMIKILSGSALVLPMEKSTCRMCI